MGKVIVSTGFEKLPKVQSGHTEGITPSVTRVLLGLKKSENFHTGCLNRKLVLTLTRFAEMLREFGNLFIVYFVTKY